MGIAVSGAEALFVGPAHARRIDASIYKNLRCMMNGGAHDYDDFTQHRSALPSLDVWRHWQLAPYAIETCVRRLKWWLDNCCTQAASYPSGHVCFGELRCAGSNTSALDPEGVICDSAHPWARRLAHDFDELPEWIDGAAALRECGSPGGFWPLLNPMSCEKFFGESTQRRCGEHSSRDIGFFGGACAN